MKKYKMVDYESGKTLLIGTAEECAKLMGFKRAESFQRYVNGIADGTYTGKKHGYKAYVYNEDEIIHKNNLKILDAFYNIYYRSPRIKEFISCGGDYLLALRMSESWCSYLELCGYDSASNYKTVEVYDKDGRLCYTGTIDAVADEFGYAKSYVRCVTSKKGRTKEGYTFKYKPFTGIEGKDNG